jgi:hypothetical protein
MNPHRKPVTLNPNIIRVSRQYAEAMTQWYASPEGAASASRSRSGDWGAEADPVRQGHGKAGEYAVALFYGLDPKTAVKRSIGFGDGGSDVTVTETKRLDVKTTPASRRWLVWSMALNDLYWDKKFDAMVSVSINDDDWSQCWIEGWIGKQEFLDRKMIADGVNDEGKLTRGTWFMRKADLDPIDTMLAGYVGLDSGGRFIHHCRCGKFGPYGYGYFPKNGKLGDWFCKEHRPHER